MGKMGTVAALNYREYTQWAKLVSDIAPILRSSDLSVDVIFFTTLLQRHKTKRCEVTVQIEMASR